MSMALTKELRAAKKFGPGYFIREQMEHRDWTQEDLAEVMGITVKHLNKILQDKQALTLDMARVLSSIFRTSAEYWINLDISYRIWAAGKISKNEEEAAIKSAIYAHMPIRDMVKKRWMKAFSSTEQLIRQVLNFWQWKKIDFSILDNNYVPCLTRKSSAYQQFNTSFAITWYRMAQIEAGKREVVAYNRRKLEALYDRIHEFTQDTKGINQFIREIESAGVIFLVLPHLQKTYLDGAAFFSNGNPVIVYTGRYKRIDNFWFTLAHEIAHVLLHINKDLPFILDNLKDGDMDRIEEEANALAAEKLKHAEILAFLKPHLGYLTTNRVEECAENYQIHPAIIIGKLAHDKTISYANQSLYNESVLTFIAKKYKVCHDE